MHIEPIWMYLGLTLRSCGAVWVQIWPRWAHMDPYVPHSGSIRIHIKAVLGPYGLLSDVPLDRYAPIWCDMKPYWCLANSCWVHFGPIWIHNHTLDPYESMLDRCCDHMNFVLGPIVFYTHQYWAHVNNIWSHIGPICKDATGLI